jgi:ABC-type glycerol-3-phosphate transport system substrate-binding protein
MSQPCGRAKTIGSEAVSGRFTRRILLGAGLGLAAAPLPRPLYAQGLSGEVTISTFEWTLPHTGSVLRAITQSFQQKHPNVRVREIPTPAPGFHDQILTQLTARTPPDIFRIDDPQLPLYIDREFLAPLEGALRDAGVDLSRAAAAARDAQAGNQTFAVVYQTNARQLIWHRGLLAEAGFQAPPRSAAELEDAVQKATRRDRGQFGYTIASRSGESTALFTQIGPIVIGFGGNFTSDDGRPAANDPRVVEALSLIRRMWDRDNVPKGLDGPTANRLIFDGRVALSLNGSFVFGAANAETKPQLNAAPSPLPSGRLMRASSWYGVAARGRNPIAAAAWCAHVMAPESQAKIAEIERVCPALPHLVPAALFEESPWLRTFTDGANNAISYLPPGLGPRAFAQIRVIADEVEAILYRGKAVQAAMDDLQRALERNLRG